MKITFKFYRTFPTSSKTVCFVFWAFLSILFFKDDLSLRPLFFPPSIWARKSRRRINRILFSALFRTPFSRWELKTHIFSIFSENSLIKFGECLEIANYLGFRMTSCQPASSERTLHLRRGETKSAASDTTSGIKYSIWSHISIIFPARIISQLIIH